MPRPAKKKVASVEEAVVEAPVVITKVEATGKFEVRSQDGKFGVAGPDGKMLSPFDMDEERAKQTVRVFNLRAFGK